MTDTPQSISTVLDQIEKAMKDGKLVILAGAGISSDPPSSKPIGFELIDLILDGLHAAYPDHMQDVIDNREFFHQMPFEDFCSLAADGWGIQEQFYHLLSPLGEGAPNYHHYAIAALLTGPCPAKVITTNFDTLIEDALAEAGREVPVTRSFAQIPADGDDRTGWIAKIHGSMDHSSSPDHPSIVNTTIGNICRDADYMSGTAWSKYLSNKTLLVVGYSGQDRLDVITTLDGRHPPSIIWINHCWDDTIAIAKAIARPTTLEIDLILARRNTSAVVTCKTSWFLEQTLGRLGLAAVRPEYCTRLCPTLSPTAEAAIDKYGLMVAARLLYRNEMYDKSAAAIDAFIDGCTQADARHFAFALMGLSDIAETRRQYARCHELLAWSEQYYRSICNPVGQQVIAVKQALICLKQDNTDGAMLHVGKAMAAPFGPLAGTRGEKSRLDEMQAWVHCVLASVQLQQGNLTEAYRLFTEATALSICYSAVRPEAFAAQQMIVCSARLINENADKKIVSLRWSEKLLFYTMRLVGLLWGMGRLSSQVYRKTQEYQELIRLLYHSISATNPGRVHHYIDNYPHVPMAVIRDELLAMDDCHDRQRNLNEFLSNKMLQDTVIEI